MAGWLEALLEFLLGIGLFIGFAVFVGWLIGCLGGPWVARSEARLARLQAGAERYGWLPSADTDGLLTAAGCRCFREGTLRRVLVGEYEGRRIRMAEFLYTTWTKSLPTTHVTNLVAIEVPVHLPELVVSHQRLTDPGLLNFDGESGAFNREYSVASPDHRYSSAMMHPRMMEWLLAHPDVSFRIFGNLVVAYSPTPWTVPHTLATLPVLSGVVDLIPPFVLTDFGHPPAATTNL